MSTVFPIDSKYFKTIYGIHQGADQPVDDELVHQLLIDGYVLSQGKFGWALTNKGREFIKTFSHDRDFIEVIRANWPTDLIAVLRRCEFNSSPDIPVQKLKDLVHTGYIVESSPGHYRLTVKGEQLLSKYQQ